jgi:hypothetical protein
MGGLCSSIPVPPQRGCTFQVPPVARERLGGEGEAFAFPSGWRGCVRLCPVPSAIWHRVEQSRKERMEVRKEPV